MSGAAWTMVGVVGAAAIIGITKFIIHSIVTGIRDELRPLWQQDIEKALEPIQSELSYNGGQSVKDIVKRIEQQVEEFLIR
jgi:hypothetical protein